MAAKGDAMAQTPKRVPATKDTLVRIRWPALAILGVAFLLWLVLVVPKLLVPARSDASLRDVADLAKRHELEDARLKMQGDARAVLLQGLGGLAVLLGAYFTFRQLQTGREQLEVARRQAQATAEQAREQLAIAQQGQVTERFTRAIDQLGSERLDVRLGGIHALERIARDSPPDRSTIGEILTAYIRQRSPWPP